MGDIKEKPSKYWADRQIADVKKTDAEALTAFKEMQSNYSKLEKELNNEVAYFYQKYGKDNILEFSSLRNKADKSDLDMLYQDWEGFAEKYPNYAHLKPVRENMYKLDRYEMLIEKSRYQLSELGAKEAEIMTRSLKETAKSTYSSMGKALSGNVAMLDDLQADKMIGTKWISGQNYSDRLWKNKDKLLGHLDYELRNGIIRGDDFITMTAHLRNITGVGKSDAERLIRTETSYIANRANMKNYIDNGLKFYEYLAVEDSRTSQACNGLNGKILELDKAIIGSNYPPLHPNCRSRGLPVSNRRAKELGIDENTVINSDIVLKDINENQYNKYKKSLGDLVPDSFEKFVELKYNEEKWNKLKYTYALNKHYSNSLKNGSLSPLVDFKDYIDMDQKLKEKLIGSTVDNIEIRSISNHFIDRVFGSVEQKRNGVTLEVINDTMSNFNERKAYEKSIRYSGERCAVTVNPITGKLIQVNPL